MTEHPLIDAIGTLHSPADKAARIVSLVPSITELLCDLGLAGNLVGRTGFCVRPKDTVRKIPKVGGTKDVNIQKIRELAPTHLVVNIDENLKPVVDELSRFIPHVIVTHPLSPLDNLKLYRLMGGIFGREERAESLCQRFEEAYTEVVETSSGLPRQNVLYLIWKSPWMTVSRDTYISQTLALVGWDTVPENAEVRYPKVELSAEFLRDVEIILLSSEPYIFRQKHVDELGRNLPPGTKAKLALIDGEMTSWYGTRAIRGLSYLKELRQKLGG